MTLCNVAFILGSYIFVSKATAQEIEWEALEMRFSTSTLSVEKQEELIRTENKINELISEQKQTNFYLKEILHELRN